MCKSIIFEKFTYERNKKLAGNEHKFLQDTRAARLLYIFSLERMKERKHLQIIANNVNRKTENLYSRQTEEAPNTGSIIKKKKWTVLQTYVK